MHKMMVRHGGPSPAQSFWAMMESGGRGINLNFDDGITRKITIGELASPVEMFALSVDGQVMLCWLANQKCRFFETSTGRPLVIDKKGKSVKSYRPQFYA